MNFLELSSAFPYPNGVIPASIGGTGDKKNYRQDARQTGQFQEYACASVCLCLSAYYGNIRQPVNCDRAINRVGRNADDVEHDRQLGNRRDKYYPYGINLYANAKHRHEGATYHGRYASYTRWNCCDGD